jgi:hypothetical protein
LGQYARRAIQGESALRVSTKKSSYLVETIGGRERHIILLDHPSAHITIKRPKADKALADLGNDIPIDYLRSLIIAYYNRK